MVKLILTIFIFLGIASAQSVTMTSRPLQVGECSSTFVTHELDYVTRVSDPTHVFADEGTGSGVAVGDLDNDQDIDMVFANLHGRNAILWNEGSWQFRKQDLEMNDSRAAAIVDVDGDGWNDIVFTRSVIAPSYWRNERGTFVLERLRGVSRLAYAMAWADLDDDGDLDLVTASYDTMLEKKQRDTFMLSSGAGVVVYTQTPTGFEEKRLAEKSQALALILFDVNADNKLDIVVGNDFAIPDFIFTNSDGEWTEAHPFTLTSRNTMSFDTGDINNDGTPELFATDMKPDFTNLNTLAQWMPLMQQTYEQQKAFPKQRAENALQHLGENGFENLSYNLRLDATGWSWAGKFGDLNNDGLLDIYVVNGMMDEDLLSHLPNNELVEENQTFVNLGESNFGRVDWGLASTQSGRGMMMADFDDDGDLDIVVNNLESPSVIFENQLCENDTSALEVTLISESKNTNAVGAILKLQTDKGILLREIKAGNSYLSSEASRVHFGISKGATLQSLEITWPDGQSSSLTDLQPNTLITITRQGDL